MSGPSSLLQQGLLPGHDARVRLDGSRIGGDRYYTPPALAEALVGTIAPWLEGCTVLEPHCGGGAFSRALERVPGVGPVLLSDADPDASALPPGQKPQDFLEWRQPVDWVVGNPPYSEAERHVRHALTLSRSGAAFLLRLAFAESQERVNFWAGPGRRLIRLYILAERPSFTGGTTDSCAYGWFVFGSTYGGRASVFPGWSWRVP